jgi:hypothetical protein
MFGSVTATPELDVGRTTTEFSLSPFLRGVDGCGCAKEGDNGTSIDSQQKADFVTILHLKM